MGKQVTITHRVEIFNDDNVRIDYQEKEQILYIDNYSRQWIEVPKATTDQDVPVLGDEVTFLAIFPSGTITMKITRDAIVEQTGDINDFFILDTTGITELSISNEDADNAVTVEIFEALETV